MPRKPIGFRPTEKIDAFLNEQINADPKLVKSDLIIKLLHAQIDHIKLEGMPNKKAFTGLLIPCPMRKYSVPYGFMGRAYIYITPKVDSSVCQTCKKYPCAEWKEIEAKKRSQQRINKITRM